MDEGIVLEGGFIPPGIMGIQLPGLASGGKADLLRQYRKMGLYGGMVSDTSTGSVRPLGKRNVIRYQINQIGLMPQQAVYPR